MMIMTDGDDRYWVPALARGLEILTLFSGTRRALGLSDIARELGVSRSSAFRLVRTLEATGFLDRENEVFQLGAKALSIGFSYLASQDIVDIARGPMKRLRDATDASSHLGILDGRYALYLARVASNRMLISNIGVGSRLPAHSTTIGRVLLGYMDSREIRALFADVPLPVQDGDGELSIDALCELVAEGRRRGYVATQSAYEHGIASAAAPILDQDGRAVAAVNVSGPSAILDIRSPAVIDALLSAARAVSEALGAQTGITPTTTSTPHRRTAS
jgi:DNA-binding IclR family transcriptional regulator